MVLSGRVVSVTVQNPDLKITDHIFGTSGTDKVNLDLKIYVPGEDYERMLESWGSILDPITERELPGHCYIQRTAAISMRMERSISRFLQREISPIVWCGFIRPTGPHFGSRRERWKLHQAPFMDAMIWKFF